jgi:hypothetical protein
MNMLIIAMHLRPTDFRSIKPQASGCQPRRLDPAARPGAARAPQPLAKAWQDELERRRHVQSLLLEAFPY